MDTSNKNTINYYFTISIVIFYLISISSQSISQEIKLNPTGRDIQLTSLIRISDTILGEADITITADNRILLPKESTLSLIANIVTPLGIKRLRATTKSRELSQHNFDEVGLNLTFDFSSLECIITVPPELSLTQQLSLSETDDLRSYVKPTELSGYLNLSLAANKSEQFSDESDRQSFYRSRFESAININKLNFEYESFLENSSRSDSKYVREGSRFNLDFPDQGTRFVLGDMYNSGRAFQDGADILGIGVTRDFSIIPTRNVRPRANQSFTLQRTSNVDVYIDGIAVRRLTLGAGSYNLNDIPLARGSNDVELVITDRSGNEERIEFSVATGSDLLNSGVFEYSVIYGVPSKFKNGQREYLTDERVFHGYIDYGVTPWLTLGMNSQVREDLYQYGITALIASKWGVTELNASHSEHPAYGAGNAYKVAFDAQFSNTNSLDPQLGISFEHITNSFTGITGFNAPTKYISSTTNYLSAFGSIYLNRSLRTAMTLNYRSGIDRKNDYWIASPSLSASLFNTPATWSARINYKHNKVGDHDISGTLALSWPLSRRSRTVGRYATKLNESELNYSYQNNIGYTGGVSAYTSAVSNNEADADVNAGVNYAANRYELSASHTSRFTDLNGEERNHLTDIKVSTALAFAGSSMTIGRPVREAFAIINKHESLADNELAIDPTRDGEHARTYLYGNSTAMVPDLVSYNSQIISYDIKDLPPGYDLGEGAFWINPGYKRGYLLQVGSDSALTVIGKLFKNQSNEPISLVAGFANYLGDEKQKPIDFFTNRNGVFAISGLKPGKYKLVLDTKIKESIIIDLNGRESTLIRLGDMYVE